MTTTPRMHPECGIDPTGTPGRHHGHDTRPARVEDLRLVPMLREVRDLLNDLRHLLEATP
jgi:hypothetical protein